VGPAVVARVRELLASSAADPAGGAAGPVPSLRVVECADPADLLDLWDGLRRVVLVDAVLGTDGELPGTVVVLRTGPERPPLPGRPWGGAGPGGTHLLGLAGAVELARALGRLPEDLAVVGVTVRGAGAAGPAAGEAAPAAFRLGSGLSPELVAVLDGAARTALRELGITLA
jgi:Ni,Fe-hydrogenase maturation factor